MRTVTSGVLLPDADLRLPGWSGEAVAELKADDVPPEHQSAMRPRPVVEPSLAARERGVAESVFLPDNRLEIQNTRSYPYSAICSLVSVFAGQQSFLGTGFLAGPRLVLTAGHNLYKHEFAPAFAQIVYVYPGLAGDRRQTPFPWAAAERLLTVEAWTTDANRDFDFGGIVLPTPLGTTAGWLSVSQFTEGTLQSMTVTVSGYPKDEPRTAFQGRGLTQWRDASRLTVESNRLLHTADSSEGQSGSPLFGYFPDKQDKFQAVGIHNWGYSAYNAATRINAAVFAQVFRWRELSDSGTR